MRKVAFLLLFLLFASACRAGGLVFAYGTEHYCRAVEAALSRFSGWRLFCYRGNPYSDASVLRLMALLKPDVLFFPESLYPLFVESGFTGSLEHVRAAGGVYIGVSSASRASDARRVVDALSGLLKKAEVPSVSPSGWWLFRLSRVPLSREKRTPVDLKIPGADAAIYRYKVDGYPRKAFLVSFSSERLALSSLYGVSRVRHVGNVYLHPHFWGRGSCSVERLRRAFCRRFGLKPDETYLLFTGVDMDCLATATERFGDITVTAAVTAGVFGNARRAGIDRGEWLRRGGMWVHVGTINILLFVNKKLSVSAMIQMVIRATEAKAAVLQELGVESSYTPGAVATGTGTDNITVVSGVDAPLLGSAGGHTKLAELVERATRRALFMALYLQNGLAAGSPICQRRPSCSLLSQAQRSW